METQWRESLVTAMYAFSQPFQGLTIVLRYVRLLLRARARRASSSVCVSGAGRGRARGFILPPPSRLVRFCVPRFVLDLPSCKYLSLNLQGTTEAIELVSPIFRCSQSLSVWCRDRPTRFGIYFHGLTRQHGHRSSSVVSALVWTCHKKQPRFQLKQCCNPDSCWGCCDRGPALCDCTGRHRRLPRARQHRLAGRSHRWGSRQVCKRRVEIHGRFDRRCSIGGRQARTVSLKSGSSTVPQGEDRKGPESSRVAIVP